MEELIHDKHLYFFEKFIRNEMSEDEKLAFENRLKTDEPFHKDFDLYISNRNVILEQELAEYNKPIIPIKTNGYRWLYVIVSLLCLVLIIDYYTNKKYEESINPQSSVIDKINIFKKLNDKINSYNKNAESSSVESEENTSQSPKTYIRKSSEDTISFEKTGEISEDIEEANADVMLFDTLLTVIDFEAFKEKQKKLLLDTDSLITDSMSSAIALRSMIKNPVEAKQQQVYVEYWQSPEDYAGYTFNGKKLILFGHQKPDNIFILKRINQIILHLSDNEILLLSDNNFHNY
ncbi:MAG: hypothetical protein EBZ58_11955 [Bacteroidetes bacterium]|nr:hypothetical protein [Bacteroidota bacterium]